MIVNGSALDIKEYAEQKNMINRYGRQDMIYVLLDKRIDNLRDEVKDLKSDVKELRGEMRDEFKAVRGDIKELRAETTQRIDALSAQMLSMKTWGIGLAVAIFLGFAGLAVPVIISLLR